MRPVRHRPGLVHPQVLAALEDLELALVAGGAVAAANFSWSEGSTLSSSEPCMMRSGGKRASFA
jgi:hypothetical protein